MTITTIIPTYNHAKTIKDSIESALRQDVGPQLSIIVSDDCSTDDTFQIATQVASQFDNVAVRRNDRNLGVMNHYLALSEMVQTPLMAILEGDDIWTRPDKLRVQSDLHHNVPALEVSFSACYVKDGLSGGTWLQPPWLRGEVRILSATDLLYGNFIATFSNCMYRTERFKNALTNPTLRSGHDWLINLFVGQQFGIGFVGRPSVEYRVHKGGAWSRLSESEKSERRIATLTKFLDLAKPDLRPFVLDAIEHAVRA
jgi:glycosyltransferase involved in cell wall biosynthesis